MKPYFHHNTTRNIIVSFGTLFNELQFERDRSDGSTILKSVPISYTPKEKFYTTLLKVDDINDDKIKIEDTLPKIGYEMTSMNSDPTRKVTTLSKMISADRSKYIKINRMPYNFNFSIYLATRKFNDSLKIVEQILPYFTPDITLEIQDFDDTFTEIPIVLESTNFEIESTGTMQNRRMILWQLDFIVKGYLYGKIDDTALIKKTIMSNKILNNSEIISQLNYEVIPNTANIDDNYIIEETRI